MPADRPNLRLLRAIVFTVGVSTLGAEIAAARLMAPFFGASTIVWANTIATVLVALSIGYWLGGRLADKRPHLAQLARWVLFASVLLALVPLVADPFLDISVQAFDDIDVGAALGSLVGVLALVAVPVLLLGAVSPWAIRLSVDRVEDAGRTAGSLYALSTIGSLFGTFARDAAADPARRHAAHVPHPRGARGARRRARAAAHPPARPGRDRRADRAPDRDDEAARGRPRARGARDGAAVRARDRDRRRRAPARAQRGPGLPLRLAARLRAHRQRLGRLPLDADQRPRPAAALDGHPRQRRGDDDARLREVLPGDRDRRRRDRRRADRAGGEVVRPARAAERAPAHGRRAAVPARGGPPLGGDPRRRLPPALHPVLPDHARVLPAHEGPARAGRRARRQRRPPRGLDQARARCSPPACATRTRTSCATRSPSSTRC